MEKRIEDAGLAIRQEMNKVLSALYKLRSDAEDMVADIEAALDAEKFLQEYDELRNAHDTVIEWIEAPEGASKALDV